MAIVLRQNKGSALTFSELDNNFQELVDATNSLTTIVTNSAQNGQAGAGSGITLTIADFSTGQNASIDLARLSDDGQGGFTSSTSPVLASIDLSADNVATASGSGSLAYSSANKRYSYTPPSISDMLGSHTINLSTQGLSGTIPSARLPSISLTSVTTVANEAAVANLSSTTQEGDVVLQTTGTKSYVRNSGTAGDINDFTELLTPDSDTTYAISMEQTGGNDTDPTLNLTPNQGTADTVTIKGGGATAVSRTDSGESVTITSTNTTYDSKAVENGFSTVSPLVTDVTNDVVTTNGAHTINDGTIIRVSETNDDTGLTLGEYTVSSTNKAGGQFTLVGVGTETTLSGANFDILNNDNPKIQLIGSDGTNDHITLTGGSNTTVTRNNDTNITIDGIGDTSYDFNADKSSDVNLPSMSSVSSDVVTFSGNHGLSDGDLVRVENAGVSGINTGDFTVSSQNGSNQFTATGIGSATGSLFSVIMTQISNSNPDLRLVGSDSTTDRVQVRGTGQVTVTRSSNELITIASSPSGTSTAIQKGDGAGGFSDATAGADFLGTIGASSGIQKGNGNGALVDAVEGTDYNSPDKIGARFRLPSGNNSVTGTHKHIEIATINITAVGESYKASFLINTTDYADNTNITETTHISIRQTDAFGNNPEIYLSTETSRKTGDMGVFCKTRKTSVTSPANLTQVKLFAVLPATGNVGAEGFVTSETVSDSTNVSATWESSFAETDYLNVSQYGALGGNGDIGDIVFLHTTRSERWADLFGSTEGITVTDGNDNNPISVIGNGTGFLKNNGSGTYSYDNTTYSTLALGTTNTTALAGDTVVDNLLLEIPKSSNTLNSGDKSWLKVATVTIDARYEYYSAQLAVVGTGAAEGVANEKILAIRVKQQAQMGQAPLVDIDIYNNGNEDYDFGHVVAVNSGTETRVDIYFRPDGPNSGAEVYKMADTVTATVAWSSTGNAYATSAPANFVQGGAHQQWHSGNQAGIFGNLSGVLQADGNGALSVATLPPDLTVDGAGTVHANNYTDTNTTYAISCVDGDATTEEKIRLTAGGSGSGTDDVVLAVGTGLSIDRTNDKITFTNTLSQGDTNQNAFSNVAVNGQTTVAADTATDTLTLVAGSNITLATDANADSVTINASGGEITVQEDGSSLSTAATTLNFVGSGVTASGTGATKTITIANILPSSTSNLEITGSGHSADLSTTISPDVPTHAAAWNLNRTVTTSNSADVRDIFVVPDGSKILVVLGSDDRKIHSYNTSPNYHPQTLTLETTDVTSFQSGEHIYGIEYNGNGTKQFLLGSDSTQQVGSKIRTHNLSTAYDTVDNSSIVSDEIEFRGAAANTGYYAVAMDFSANGDTVFFLGADDGDAVLVSYALSSNYDITELTSGNSDVVYSVASYSGTSRVKNLTTLAGTDNGPNFTGVSSQDEEANHKFDLSVESDGKTIYVLDGENNNIIYTYELSSANDLSTLSYFGARKVFGVDPDAMCITSDAANNVAFVGGSNNKIFQYDNDVSGTKITSSNTHFSGNVSANGELNVDGDVLMTGNVAVGTVTTDILNATTGPHTITATGDNDITISTASSSSAGNHGSTGVITIGTAAQNVVNIGHGGNGLGFRQYVNIGTNVQGTSVLALDIGEQTTASTPTSAVTQTINIGSNYGTYNQDISLYGDILLSPGKTEIAGGITSLNANVQARTITIGADHQTGDITLGLSTKSQTVNIASATNTGSKSATVNIAQGGGTRTVNIASDSINGSTTVVNLGNPSGTANSTVQVRGNLSIDRPMYGNGATEYYDFFDHLGGVDALGSDGDWDISGTGLNALTEITIPATSHIGTMGKRGSLRMTCQSTFYNTSSTTKRNAEYYLGLQMKSKGTSSQSENLGVATFVSSPSQFNGVWSFAGNVTDKIVAGFGSLGNSSTASGMTNGPAPIVGAVYDSADNKTYIRVSSYYYYNTLGGSAVTAGNSTSFDVYYNPTEFKVSGTWVSSLRADSYNSRTRMTVQPLSTHQMHHAFNISLPKETSKTELRLVFDYSGSNTNLQAAVYAVEGTVMLEGSRV